MGAWGMAAPAVFQLVDASSQDPVGPAWAMAAKGNKVAANSTDVELKATTAFGVFRIVLPRVVLLTVGGVD